jgi:hypothetical protein
MFSKYKRKPLVVDADQWDGSQKEAERICSRFKHTDYYANTNHIQVQGMHMSPKDWLVVSDNTICIYKPDEFKEAFEKVIKTRADKK